MSVSLKNTWKRNNVSTLDFCLSAALPKIHPHPCPHRPPLPTQSYAGKYIPAFATALHEGNQARKAAGLPLVPLLGFAIGDGWTEPSAQTQVQYV